jgi:nucleoside-diphosphate-sugar epimerase
MQSVISACEKAKARLIFFDNVYMYGPAPPKVPFDETHIQSPISKKGIVRKKIAGMLLESHNAGRQTKHTPIAASAPDVN